MTAKALPAIFSVIAVIAGGCLAATLASFGPLSIHMATHIAAMNVVAPLLAMLLLHMGFVVPRRLASLWASAGLQIIILIAWHMPPLHHALASSIFAAALAGCVLTFAALLFWLALLTHAAASPWQAMLALMLTGKVTCLLGGILVFAPRDLYAALSHHGTSATPDDQQLAGLLMLAVCPLSYVVAGITIAAQMMARLERQDATPLATKQRAETASP